MTKTETSFKCIIYFINIFILAIGQQVPPGVNPSHYQQPPQHVPQQHYQQAPVEQQYQHQQHQQYQHQPPPPPVQQQQQQYQQPPPQQQPQGGHGHVHSHHGEPQLLNTANIGQEREHIQEHLDVPIDTSKMSEKELHYHYFTMHDSDKNNKLDGCELIKSLIHWHGGNKADAPVLTDEQLSRLVDLSLKRHDLDFDGYITYSEYSLKANTPRTEEELQAYKEIFGK